MIVLAQLPVTQFVEGRRRMAMLATMTVFWSAAWLLVLAGGLWAAAAAGTALVVVAAAVFGVGECFQGATQQALIADLAPPQLRGRYMALSTNSWSIGWIVGPALGGVVLQVAPNALWASAAAVCAAAGLAALYLERSVPELVRRTPSEGPAVTPPPPDPSPEAESAARVAARASG